MLRKSDHLFENNVRGMARRYLGLLPLHGSAIDDPGRFRVCCYRQAPYRQTWH